MMSGKACFEAWCAIMLIMIGVMDAITFALGQEVPAGVAAIQGAIYGAGIFSMYRR